MDFSRMRFGSFRSTSETNRRDITNDRRLVDIAASRPGRFDLIIDVNLIHPDHYLELVRNKTKVPEIVSLFDDGVLTVLEQKKVTGAFITNLVKHLDLVRSFDPGKLTRQYLLEMIQHSFTGFYKEPQSTATPPGFQLS